MAGALTGVEGLVVGALDTLPVSWLLKGSPGRWICGGVLWPRFGGDVGLEEKRVEEESK